MVPPEEPSLVQPVSSQDALRVRSALCTVLQPRQGPNVPCLARVGSSRLETKPFEKFGRLILERG